MDAMTRDTRDRGALADVAVWANVRAFRAINEQLDGQARRFALCSALARKRLAEMEAGTPGVTEAQVREALYADIIYNVEMDADEPKVRDVEAVLDVLARLGLLRERHDAPGFRERFRAALEADGSHEWVHGILATFDRVVSNSSPVGGAQQQGELAAASELAGTTAESARCHREGGDPPDTDTGRSDAPDTQSGRGADVDVPRQDAPEGTRSVIGDEGERPAPVGAQSFDDDALREDLWKWYTDPDTGAALPEAMLNRVIELVRRHVRPAPIVTVTGAPTDPATTNPAPIGGAVVERKAGP